MKVWFQNRRTKHKRGAADDGEEDRHGDRGGSDSEFVDVESPGSPNSMAILMSNSPSPSPVKESNRPETDSHHLQNWGPIIGDSNYRFI